MNKKHKHIYILLALLISINSTFAQTARNPVLDAQILIDQGNYLQAEKVLLDELNKNPNNQAAKTELINFYIETNQHEKASKFINSNKPASDNPNNINDVPIDPDQEEEKRANDAIENDPYNDDAYVDLGKIYYKKSESAELIDKVELSKKEKSLKKSFDYFSKAVELNPMSADAHIGLAKVYIAKSKPEKAYEELLKAEECQPQNSTTLYALGESFYKLNKLDKAIRHLKNSAEINHFNQNTHMVLGKIYQKLGFISEAKEEFYSVLDINPDNIQAQEYITALQQKAPALAKIASNKNENPLPDELKQIIEADFYLFQDRFTEARNQYLKILDKNQRNMHAYIGIAELYYSHWKLGYFDSKNYFVDRKHFKRVTETPRLKVSLIKLDRVNKTGLPEPIKRDLQSIAAYDRFEPEYDPNSYYKLLNAQRANFILGNYTEAQSRLQTLLDNANKPEDKYEIAKYMFLDHNYYEAKKLFNSLTETIDPEKIKLILDRINKKTEWADNFFKEGVELYNKKKFDEADKKFEQIREFFPTYKMMYLYQANMLQKQEKPKEALQKLEMYNMFNNLYPEEGPEINEKEMRKLLKPWEEKKKKNKNKKDGE